MAGGNVRNRLAAIERKTVFMAENPGISAGGFVTRGIPI
jgi:hypothetical protein